MHAKSLIWPYMMSLLVVFGLAYAFVVPAEDAVVLYNYAKNLATRGVITYSDAAFPIEGATDFLWMAIIGGLKYLGVDEFVSALALNFVGVAAMALVAQRLKTPAWLFVIGLLGTPYLYSSLAGFSTLFFSAFYVLALYFCLQHRTAFYPLLLILCLIRPDGVVWGAGLVLLRAFEIGPRIASRSELTALIGQLVVPGLIYFGWRYWYFGEILPLPFIVKASVERDWLIFYFESIVYLGYALLPAIAATLLVEDRRLYLKRLLLLVAVPVIFYGAIRMEQNVGNRFLAPMFFGSLILLSLENKLRATLGYVIVAILASVNVTAPAMVDLADSRNENVYFISQALKDLRGTMLITEAGRLAYYSGWSAQDSWGLNTPAYAHTPIGKEDLEARSYDLIVAHCDSISEPDGQAGPDQVAATRSWENQCRVLTGYITSADYDVFLVPFRKTLGMKRRLFNMATGKAPRSECVRHDLYAVSRKFADAAALERILTAHGAISYRENRDFFRDGRLCSATSDGMRSGSDQ